MTPDETSTNAREEILKELLLRKQQRKKIGTKTSLALELMTSLLLKLKIIVKNKVSFNLFFNTLLTKFFN